MPATSSAVDDAIRLAFDPHVCEYGVDCRRCDQIERGRVALRSLVETVQRSQWREMDSAPKDGTVVLCYFPGEPERHRQKVGFFLPNVPSGVFGALFGHDLPAPSKWMPLPAPPQTREET